MYGRGTRSLWRTLGLRHYHNVTKKKPKSLRHLSVEDKKHGTSTVKHMMNDASKDRSLADKAATEALRMGGDFTAEKAAFAQEQEEERATAVSFDKDEAPTKLFEPGTFVEIRKPGTCLTGIILGTQFIARHVEYLTLTTTGAVWAHTKDDIVFDVPQLVPAELIARCGTSITPRSSIEHSARVEALKRLRGVDNAVQQTSHAISQTPYALYTKLKSPNPAKAETTTAAEVARLLFKNVGMVNVYAAHRWMMSNPLYFGASYDYQLSQKFTIQPFERVQLVNTVTAWTKQPDGPIKSFVEKARKIREYTTSLPESPEPTASTSEAWWTWTDDDKTIIRFLLNKMKLQIGAQTDPSLIGTYYIIQKIIQDEQVDDAIVQRVLAELGVIAPWGDLTPMAAELTDYAATEGEELAKKSFQRMKTNHKGPLGPEDFYPTDPLEHLRHDFGDMPVYVVDDPGAKELDDGMSIEPAGDGAHWVHVHVADPTSILPPTHALARDDGDSVYLYYRNYPMLPRGLTHNDSDPRKSLSLHGFGAQNVLTFSAKVRLTGGGEILDYKVRPGIIRNKIFTSYATVNEVMGWQMPEYKYPFGCTPKLDPPEDVTLTKNNITHLGWLKTLADSAISKRFNDGIFNHTTSRAELVDINWPSTSPEPDRYTLEPTVFKGFPRMSYRVSSSHLIDVGAHSVIAEAMKLACRVSSLFCRDRDIPILRRYALPPVVLPTPEGRRAYDELIDSRTPNGYVEYTKSFNALAFDSVGGFSVDPKEHYGLGIPDGEGYVRTTSPLRRRSDLVGHWQIQNALLGKSPVFSRQWMEDLAVRAGTKTRMVKRVQGVHEAYYHVLFLQRYLQLRKEGRMGPLTFHTYSNPALNLATKVYHVEGEIHSLGLRAILVDAPKYMEVGRSVAVELAGEDATVVGLRPKVRVRPIK